MSTVVDMPQRMRSLAHAQEVRIAGARLRRRLAAGEIWLAEALDHPDAGSVQIGLLLRAIPRLGEHTMQRILLRAGVAGSHKHVDKLTQRQRQAILEATRDLRRT